MQYNNLFECLFFFKFDMFFSSSKFDMFAEPKNAYAAKWYLVAFVWPFLHCEFSSEVGLAAFVFSIVCSQMKFSAKTLLDCIDSR